MTVKVVLLDDEEVTRGGIRLILEPDPGIEAGDQAAARGVRGRLPPGRPGADHAAGCARARRGGGPAAGLSNAAVAAELYLSESAVKVHVAHVLTKLDAANRTQA